RPRVGIVDTSNVIPLADNQRSRTVTHHRFAADIYQLETDRAGPFVESRVQLVPQTVLTRNNDSVSRSKRRSIDPCADGHTPNQSERGRSTHLQVITSVESKCTTQDANNPFRLATEFSVKTVPG